MPVQLFCLIYKWFDFDGQVQDINQDIHPAALEVEKRLEDAREVNNKSGDMRDIAQEQMTNWEKEYKQKHGQAPTKKDM